MKKSKNISDEELISLLADAEKERIKRLFIGISLTIIFLILPISILFYKTPIKSYEEYFTLSASLLSFGLACFVLPIMNHLFIGYLKSNYIQQVCKYFDGLKWERFDLPIDLLHSSKLFGSFNEYETDDMFTGKYHCINYKIMETKMNDIQNNDITSFKKTNVFEGVIIEFASNKKTTTSTIVTTKHDMNIRNLPIAYLRYILYVALTCLPVYIIEFRQKISFETFYYILITPIFIVVSIIIIIKEFHKENKTLEQIKLEDVKWDKKFNVYSNNQIEARYLLTTTFMERFYHLQTAFGTKKIKCSFVEDKLVIAISTNKDLFEIGNLFDPLQNLKQINKFREELKSILLLIEYLKLDQNTGL